MTVDCVKEWITAASAQLLQDTVRVPQQRYQRCIHFTHTPRLGSSTSSTAIKHSLVRLQRCALSLRSTCSWSPPFPHNSRTVLRWRVVVSLCHPWLRAQFIVHARENLRHRPVNDDDPTLHGSKATNERRPTTHNKQHLDGPTEPRRGTTKTTEENENDDDDDDDDDDDNGNRNDPSPSRCRRQRKKLATALFSRQRSLSRSHCHAQSSSDSISHCVRRSAVQNRVHTDDAI